MGLFEKFGKLLAYRKKQREEREKKRLEERKPRPIRAPRKEETYVPVSVGPEEEKEEDIRKEKVASQDDFDIGKEAMVALKEHLVSEGYKGVDEQSYEYRDGTIDYEVRIPLKKGDEREVRMVFMDIEDYFQAPASYMVSTGFRVPTVDIEDVEERYLVLEGQVILGAHYQHADDIRYNIQTSMINFEGLIRNKRHNPKEIFVRLFFSPTKSQPNREDYTNGIISRDEAWS